MDKRLKHDWLIVLFAGAVAVFVVLLRKGSQVAAQQATEPQAGINIPAAASTPDYLSYNLPAFQKPDLVLPTVAPLAPPAAEGSNLGALRANRPDASEAKHGGCGCGPSVPKCSGGANAGRVASVGQLTTLYARRYPDLSARLSVNLATAFPHRVANGSN